MVLFPPPSLPSLQMDFILSVLTIVGRDRPISSYVKNYDKIVQKKLPPIPQPEPEAVKEQTEEGISSSLPTLLVANEESIRLEKERQALALEKEHMAKEREKLELERMEIMTIKQLESEWIAEQRRRFEDEVNKEREALDQLRRELEAVKNWTQHPPTTSTPLTEVTGQSPATEPTENLATPHDELAETTLPTQPQPDKADDKATTPDAELPEPIEGSETPKAGVVFGVEEGATHLRRALQGYTAQEEGELSFTKNDIIRLVVIPSRVFGLTYLLRCLQGC